MIARRLAQRWKLVLAQGLYALVFGLAIVVWPEPTVGVVIVLFGLFAVVFGVVGLVAAAFGWVTGLGRLLALVNGVAAVALGVAVLAWPDLSARALLYLIGAFAVAVGLLQVAAALEFRDQLRHERFVALVGLVSIAFGVALVGRSGETALTLAALIGTYALVYGALLVVAAFRLRALARG